MKINKRREKEETEKRKEYLKEGSVRYATNQAITIRKTGGKRNIKK